MAHYRSKFVFKIIAVYLIIYIISPQAFIHHTHALTEGPSQPEFNSFTPIETSNMVNLSTGDFNYNIPVMDVGGYPLNLSYNSGITMDQEASWVGLGWNLNVGQINRNVRGIPDDFDGSQEDGDLMTYENNHRDNITVGASFGVGLSLFGLGEEDVVDTNIGLGIQHNNYTGISFNPTIGVSFALSESNSAPTVGLSLSGSATEGASITPSISLGGRMKDSEKKATSGSLGITINSRQALSTLNLGLSKKEKNDKGEKRTASSNFNISFNDLVLFTPTKRVGTLSSNFTFSASVSPSAFGFDAPQMKISGFSSIQRIQESEKNKITRAFGYDHTEKNELSHNGILDFNREKDRVFNKNTTLLPLVNYTYDMYSINGQGIGGTFRPYRSQIGFVNDSYVADYGIADSFGAEVGFGWNFKGGFDVRTTFSNSSTGLWVNKNNALNNFTKSESNSLDYEKVYYRTIGEINVDNENDGNGGLFEDQLKANNPIHLVVSGNRKYKRRLENTYRANPSTGVQSQATTVSLNQEKLKRSNRLLRNQSVQKVQVKEVTDTRGNNPFFEASTHAKPHHTAGFSILKPDGSNYIFGKAVYNTTKKEATFAINSNGNCSTGLVTYNPSADNSPNNNQGRDYFFNRITTPAYAHTYLLTSILSSDYEDLTGNGPTDDDLGAYTKFNYGIHYNYNWRVPFQLNSATANRGLYSEEKDQKGNYIYGEREQTYIQSIETKTHIATFHLSPREDARGVVDENGGLSNGSEEGAYSQKLDSIQLFSKRDFFNGLENPIPIKTAHFKYSYSLCPGVPNSNASNQGKLTLEKVYFTYKNSKMGAYMPYIFNYGELDLDGDGIFGEPNVNIDTDGDGTIDYIDEISNPAYHIKGYDIWGNYKENDGNCEVTSYDGPTNSEFPYVRQDKELADYNTIAWNLTSVGLPSGGNLQIEYESDDYQYVQDKKVMQLYSVTGAGSNPPVDDKNQPVLYGLSGPAKYLYVKIPENQNAFHAEDFVNELIKEPIFFKFLVQMVKNSQTKYDYVSGYLKIDENHGNGVEKIGDHLAIPMKYVKLDRNGQASPISKAGWMFGRQNMNRIVYSTGGYSENTDPVAIITDLVGSIGSFFQIFKGPNKILRDKGVAKEFKSNKSWIRLINPTKHKLGGGARVKKLQMDDNWDVMTNNENNPLYQKFYGQQYNYNLEDGSSSGVATFEPNGSRENPFVMPFYDRAPDSNKDAILAPQETNYAEKPIGESFFPSPSVTYGRVTVENLPYSGVTRHATGKVVNEFYTSKDFPTTTDYTELDSKSLRYDKPSTLSQLLNFSVKTHVTASQGFSIELNDMNGKQKAQWIYAEGAEEALSGVEYKYFEDASGRLINKLPVIDHTGAITEQLIGVNYDVVNDFRESNSTSESVGVNVNFGGFILVLFPIFWGVPLPSYSHHENILRTATTTKVIQKHGVLKEKIAYDLGARVSTENLAWDANTGEVLSTKTINDFDDAYYSLNYPAYWKNVGMNSATINLGLEGVLNAQAGTSGFVLSDKSNTSLDASDYLLPGDELFTYDPMESGEFYNKLWVVSTTDDKVILMDRNGKVINECLDDQDISTLEFKVIRSAYRNIQTASMASITSKVNPIFDPETSTMRTNIPSFTDVDPSEYKIINASAVEYSNFWKTQREAGIPFFPVGSNIYNQGFPIADEYGNLLEDLNEDALLSQLYKYNINPYIHNMKGDWKARRSWAYLTGRQQSSEPNLKEDGYLTSFTPFYIYNAGKWQINTEAVIEDTHFIEDKRWTFASEVTLYSPHGIELENKDALNRFSAAQYGYKYTLPTAVASNSEYREIGFEGFEDPKGTPEVDPENVRLRHFSFGHSFDLGAFEIAHNTAHTGRKSVKVAPERAITLIRTLSEYTPQEVEDCIDDEPVDNCSLLQPMPSVTINSGNPGNVILYRHLFGTQNIESEPSIQVMSHAFNHMAFPCSLNFDNENQVLRVGNWSNCLSEGESITEPYSIYIKVNDEPCDVIQLTMTITYNPY